MKVALDTNCFINAVDESATDYAYLQRLFSAANSGKITAVVSRHTLAELKTKAAHELASKLELLPHWPIGTIAEQVAQIRDLSGTWEDARRNEEIQTEIAQLAKSGNDIRDRGAYLDALLGGADIFVTSDKQLVGSGPAKRLQDRFGLRVLNPRQIASEIVATAAAHQNSKPSTQGT